MNNKIKKAKNKQKISHQKSYASARYNGTVISTPQHQKVDYIPTYIDEKIKKHEIDIVFCYKTYLEKLEKEINDIKTLVADPNLSIVEKINENFDLVEKKACVGALGRISVIENIIEKYVLKKEMESRYIEEMWTKIYIGKWYTDIEGHVEDIAAEMIQKLLLDLDVKMNNQINEKIHKLLKEYLSDDDNTNKIKKSALFYYKLYGHFTKSGKDQKTGVIVKSNFNIKDFEDNGLIEYKCMINLYFDENRKKKLSEIMLKNLSLENEKVKENEVKKILQEITKVVKLVIIMILSDLKVNIEDEKNLWDNIIQSICLNHVKKYFNAKNKIENNEQKTNEMVNNDKEIIIKNKMTIEKKDVRIWNFISQKMISGRIEQLNDLDWKLLGIKKDISITKDSLIEITNYILKKYKKNLEKYTILKNFYTENNAKFELLEPYKTYSIQNICDKKKLQFEKIRVFIEKLNKLDCINFRDAHSYFYVWEVLVDYSSGNNDDKK